MRRVLIITYDFPPVGGSGVQRVAKFAKYLPRFGWQPVVLTTRHGRPIPRDASLLDEISHIEIHRTPAPHPYRIFGTLASWLGKPQDPERFSADMKGSRRGPWHPTAWLIPDGKISWIPFGITWALRAKHETRCQAILASLPTPSAAILGSILSRLWGVPHVIDYRDPWSGGAYLPRRFRLLTTAERSLERRILVGARAIVVVPGAGECLPNAATPLEILHNGYDEEDFSDVTEQRLGPDFVIAHVGIIWKERGVQPLIAALQLLRARSPLLADRFHFLQVGRADPEVAAQLNSLRAQVRVTALSSVSHREAIAYMMGADLLYLPTSHDHVPGKTYEYLRSRKPILALGRRWSHLDRLLAETGGGQFLEPDDTVGIAEYIERVATDPANQPPADATALRRYSREATTQALATLLDRVYLESQRGVDRSRESDPNGH